MELICGLLLCGEGEGIGVVVGVWVGVVVGVGVSGVGLGVVVGVGVSGVGLGVVVGVGFCVGAVVCVGSCVGFCVGAVVCSGTHFPLSHTSPESHSPQSICVKQVKSYVEPHSIP